MKTDNIDTTPREGETIVAFWRISSGRIVAALFVRNGNDFRYRTDNGGGFLAIPNVDIILQNAEDAAIRYLGQRVAEAFKSAKCILGAPGYVSM
jgi:hypothetical protein